MAASTAIMASAGIAHADTLNSTTLRSSGTWSVELVQNMDRGRRFCEAHTRNGPDQATSILTHENGSTTRVFFDQARGVAPGTGQCWIGIDRDR